MIAPIAMLIDAALGEPDWIWSRVKHPVVYFGEAINYGEERWNNGTSRMAKGTGLIVGLVVLGILSGQILEFLPTNIVDILVAAILLAHKSLIDHIKAVRDALGISLADAQKEVAAIVGRDTDSLNESGVTRATLESAAENFSDGVVAPLFWLLVAGLPGIIAYKIINTADSMIGYKTERYMEFGWAAARLDDVANFIPARLTALLFMIAARDRTYAHVIFEDAPKHRSPNAGWPEAGLAVALDVALAGPRSYNRREVDYPFVNEFGQHDLGPTHIDKAVTLLWKAWTIAIAVALVISLLT